MFLPGNAHRLLKGSLQMKAALPFPSLPLSSLSLFERNVEAFSFFRMLRLFLGAARERRDTRLQVGFLGFPHCSSGEKKKRITAEGLIFTCGILAKSRG